MLLRVFILAWWLHDSRLILFCLTFLRKKLSVSINFHVITKFPVIRSTYNILPCLLVNFKTPPHPLYFHLRDKTFHCLALNPLLGYGINMQFIYRWRKIDLLTGFSRCGSTSGLPSRGLDSANLHPVDSCRPSISPWVYLFSSVRAASSPVNKTSTEMSS